MFQNLKVDIVYYKTNTDFEMEFNLCGCCRMRLLTDKSPDRKTALHSLARAVSRSRIIIVTGSLFGEEGIIKLVSGAIGFPLEKIEKGKYNISGDDELEILKGATPLVTQDGYFGGCIVESGPQTMILISENKTIRKSIMQTLIHPYVEELCATELKEKAAAVSENSNVSLITDIPEENNNENTYETEEIEDEILIGTEETDAKPYGDTVEDSGLIFDAKPDCNEVLLENAISDDELIVEVTDQIDGESLLINDEYDEEIDTEKEAAETDAIVSSGMIFETDEEIEIKPVEDEVEDDIIADTEPEDIFSNNRMTPDNAQDDLLMEDDDYFAEPPRRFSPSINLTIMIVAILMLVLLAVLCYCIFYIPAKDGVSASEYIKETFNILFGKA